MILRWLTLSFWTCAVPVMLLAALLATFLSGCATYQNKVGDARKLLGEHKAAEAAKDLKPLAETDSRDQLVYVLDYATALQQAGNYKESAEEFARAQKIADIQDYHSISKITESLVLSEEFKQYKGDDYEKVLINAINAINYLDMGSLDDAQVEVRRLNEMLYRFRTEAKKNYNQNPYAYYLSAMIWEANGKWDDAYIDYKNAYGLVPDYKPLHEDLIRLAMKAQRSDELAKWQGQFPEVKIKKEWRDPAMGELVLIYQQGWGPRKLPRPGARRFPELFPVATATQRAYLKVDDGPGGAYAEPAYEIFSVQKVAIKTLEDDYAALVAMRAAGLATKAVIADQIAQHNQLLGLASFIAMNAADRADLRQWSTLPQTFQIARLPMKAGKYHVHVEGQTISWTPTGESMPGREIVIRPGQKVFIDWRSFR